jgi:hypothetical protein
MSIARPWIVLPHEPLQKLENNLWVAQGKLTRPTQVLRRAHFIKLSDGRLVAHPGMCLDEASMHELEAWGEVSFIIVPNGLHRLDAHAWRERYPKAKVLCPPQSRLKIEKIVQTDGDLSLLPKDPALELIIAAGWKSGEPILLVRSGENGERVSLCFSDVIMNMHGFKGFEGFVLGTLGALGSPRVTPFARILMVRDKKALKAQLLALAQTPRLARLVPCHGEIVESRAAEALTGAAMRL